MSKKNKEELFKSIYDCNSFDELSERNKEISIILFATIINRNKSKSWKSYRDEENNYWFEDNNSNWFIVGLDTPKGPFAMFFPSRYWEAFDCKERKNVAFTEDMLSEPTRLFSLK